VLLFLAERRQKTESACSFVSSRRRKVRREWSRIGREGGTDRHI